MVIAQKNKMKAEYDMGILKWREVMSLKDKQGWLKLFRKGKIFTWNTWFS